MTLTLIERQVNRCVQYVFIMLIGYNIISESIGNWFTVSPANHTCIRINECVDQLIESALLPLIISSAASDLTSVTNG